MSSSTEDLEGRTEEAVDTNHLIVFVGEEEVHLDLIEGSTESEIQPGSA